MSLPDNGRLVLQGPALPGDPTQAAPKKSAILLRMSTETFAALERDTKMDIELTGQPKLYIGDQCFTMRTADIGDTSQELYVRMLQANKAAAAPLKLQGNIVGRLTVERELGEQVEKNIRDLSHQLEKSKNERKIQILPEIPKDLAPTKTQVKSKKPTKVTKSTPAGHAPIDPNRSASTSLQPSRVASQRPSPRPSHPGADTARSSGISESRLRLLHYAALRPRTTEDLMAAMEGDIPVARSEVEALITQTLEKIPAQRNGTNPDAGKWQLKTESWLDIRPFTYGSLEKSERLSLARQARLAYGVLNIPQTDRRWAYVREPARVSDDARSSSRSPLPPAPAETKKPMVTKKTKPVETIVKRKVVATVPAKDEGTRIPKIEREPTPTIPPAKTVARREPGSGFRAKSQSSTPPATGSPMLAAAQPVKKQSPAPKREAPSPAPGPSRPSSAMPPPQAKPRPRDGTPLAQEVKKKKEPSSAAHPDPNREKKRPAVRDEPLDRVRKRPRDITESEYSERESVASISFKKRKLEEPRRDKERGRDSDRDTPRKREKERQIERERERPKEKERARDRVEAKAEPRNPTLPKKPITRDASPHVPPARTKPLERERERERERGREPTPRNAGRSTLPPRPRSPVLPPRPAAHDRLASVASNNSSHSRYDDHSSRNGSTRGRQTPSFTSSEDESSESKPVNRKRRDVPRRASPPPRKAEARPRKLPDNADDLRDMYDRLYPDYIRKLKRHRRLHDRIVRTLESSKDAELEIDFDPLSDSELQAIKEDAEKAEVELDRIIQAYASLTRGRRLDNNYDSR